MRLAVLGLEAGCQSARAARSAPWRRRRASRILRRAMNGL